MAPLTKYAAALAVFMSSISAIPLEVVNDLPGWNEAGGDQAGTFQSLSDIDLNAPHMHHSDVGNLTAHIGLEKRQVDCANRPGDVSGIAVCGPDFVDMGSKGWGPALAAMPQWNHARLNTIERSCYPESASNANGDGPNPGLPSSAGSGQAVGTDCRDPNDGQSYSGPLMRAAPFPVYVDGVYCPGDTTWRIVYSLYYPKDYNHRHDWERAIVVFSKSSGDWWERKALLLAQHSGFNKLRWDQATAHNDPYASSGNRGEQGAHPRVFPGMYHHATYNEAKTSCLGPGCDSNEYRRNNWQYSPVLGDIRNGLVDFPEAWGDNDGKTPPWKVIPQVCGIGLP